MTSFRVALICLLAPLVVAPSIANATFPGANGRIYFTDLKELYSVKPNGRDLQKHTSGKNLKNWPSVSPDGRSVIYGSLEAPDYRPWSIKRLDVATGTTSTVLADAGDSNGFGLSYSGPLGRRIAYSHEEDQTHIRVIAADGTRSRQLTSTKRRIDSEPAFSADGEWIAFAGERPRHSYSEIYRMRADGSRKQKLTDFDGFAYSPTYSPDGRHIVFSLDRSGDVEDDIMIMRSNGTHVRRLTSGKRQDNNPVFSPNGKRIAFEGSGGPSKLFVMRRDGTRERQITKGSPNPDEIDWAVRP